MAQNPSYVKYQPKVYRRPLPMLWWTYKPGYFKFMMREFTSVFVAIYVLVLLFFVRAVAQGQGTYDSFVAALKSPFAIIFHIIALAFVIFHSITWFSLAPKAMVVRLGKTKVPGPVIVWGNVAAWVVLSLFIAWLLKR